MATKKSEYSLGKRIMAKRCEQCPACRYARNHPQSKFGRFMAWHGTWCPFWKAYEEVKGTESAKSEVSAG